MKKAGIILLTIVASLSLLAGPAMANVDAGRGQGKGNTWNQVKTKPEVRERAEKRIQTRLTNMSSEQKEKVRSRLKEHEKKAVKRQFSDAGQHWAKTKIERVQTLGLISGYEDGTFKPDDPVTMTEAMVMAVNLAENLDVEGETSGEGTSGEGTTQEGTVGEVTEEEGVPEIPGWAKEKAKKAAVLKIINVNRFHSQVQATRAQAAVMLAKALGLQPVAITGVAFSDAVLISPEDIGYILALKEAGIVKGTPDGKFNPNSSVTRAEIAAMLANMADTVENGETGGQTPEGGTTDQGTQPAGGAGTGSQTTQGGTSDQGTQPATGTGTVEQAGESGTVQ